mgnify:CR=1 FL=1
MDSARDKIDRATWISMFISIPCAVGLAVLAGPITRLLFPRTEGAAAQLMMLGVITIILNGIPIFPMVCYRESESPISP